MAITTQLAQILIPIMHHCLKSTDPQFKDEQLAKLLASLWTAVLFFLFLSFLVLFTVGGGSHVAVILLIGQTPVSPPWIRLKKHLEAQLSSSSLHDFSEFSVKSL